MSEIVKMSDQFGGLPMDQLIGAPLTAACDAQVTLAKATSDFIQTVGFEDKKVRMVEFAFSKPEQVQAADGTVSQVSKDYKVNVPFISIVSVPTLQVTEVDINFMMEVKSSFSEATKDAKSGTVSVAGGGGLGPFSVKAKVQGSVATSKDTQRSSDNSAKYDVSIKARQSGTPEGLSRVLDILQQSIAPVPV
jgi:hypothetical protein